MNPNPFRSVSLALLALAALHPARAASDYATPYFFSTLAGVSSIGSQDGAGAAARFYSPRAVAVDSTGNAFVVDTGNHTIRKITPTGVVTTFAGTAGLAGSADGTGGAARFDDPHDIAADAADNLYVTDTGNHTIRKITPAGVVSTFAGLAGVSGKVDGPGTLARFNVPLGIALDPAGNVYVTESGNGTIRKLTPAGEVSTFARDLSFRDPYYYAIAADAAGNAYVARFVTRNFTNYSIDGVLQADEIVSDIGFLTKVAPDGTLTFLSQSTVITHHPEGKIPDINTPFTDVVVESSGKLLVAGNGKLLRFSPPDSNYTVISGSGIPGSADGPATTARYGGLLGLATDRNGTIYVADSGNNNFRKVTASGDTTTLAGIALDVASGFADGTGAAARFNNPAGTAVDAAGNIYLADRANHVIRKITPAGVATTLAGAPGVPGSADGTGTAARFSSPNSVALDSAGNAYVADTNNHIIRKVRPSGETSTLAGTAGAVGWADGTGADARFWYPYGTAVDTAGNVYVTSAGTVRKIDPNGVTTTLAGHASDVGYVDGTGSSARFAIPYGITVDASGNLFVTEPPDGPTIARIRKITPAGVVTTVAGAEQGTTDGNGTAARFHNPYGVTVDAAGNLFVADSFNQIIRKISPQGAVTTLAGLVDAPGSTDDTGQVARFYYPNGIAVNAAGTLYVTSGTTVRKGVLATLPVIATQPSSLSITAGNGASFTVTAGGTPAPTFQWQRNGSAISGATQSSFTLASAQTSDAGDYTVVVTNALGSVTSAKATLTVTAAPTPPPPATSGGGGGGAPSVWFLLSLGTLRLLRRLGLRPRWWQDRRRA